MMLFLFVLCFSGLLLLSELASPGPCWVSHHQHHHHHHHHRVGNLVSIGRNYEPIAENRRGRSSVWVKFTNGILVEEEEEEERERRGGGGYCVSLPFL